MSHVIIKSVWIGAKLKTLIQCSPTNPDLDYLLTEFPVTEQTIKLDEYPDDAEYPDHTWEAVASAARVLDVLDARGYKLISSTGVGGIGMFGFGVFETWTYRKDASQ